MPGIGRNDGADGSADILGKIAAGIRCERQQLQHGQFVGIQPPGRSRRSQVGHRLFRTSRQAHGVGGFCGDFRIIRAQQSGERLRHLCDLSRRGELVDIHHGPVANLLPRGCETLREIRQRLRSNFRGKLRQPVQPLVIIAFVPQYLAEGRRGQALRLEKKSQIPGVPQEAAHLAPQPPYLLRAGRIVHAVVYLVRIFHETPPTVCSPGS